MVGAGGEGVEESAEARAEAEAQQERLKGVAEIAEMIHVASLLHDDVIDEASTRRGIGSVRLPAR